MISQLCRVVLRDLFYSTNNGIAGYLTYLKRLGITEVDYLER